MGWDEQHGCCGPGSQSKFPHLGDPLTAAQIRALADGTEVMITWSGGNGPHPYRILVCKWGIVRVETGYADSILTFQDQVKPMNRVTLGWSPEARSWMQERVPEPPHIHAKWARMRGQQ